MALNMRCSAMEGLGCVRACQPASRRPQGSSMNAAGWNLFVLFSLNIQLLLSLRFLAFFLNFSLCIHHRNLHLLAADRFMPTPNATSCHFTSLYCIALMVPFPPHPMCTICGWIPLQFCPTSRPDLAFLTKIIVDP